MMFMTLNTHSLSECDEKNKLQTIENFILNHDVDVICLQEVNQSMTAKSVSTDKSYVGRDIIKEDNYALGLSQLLGDQYNWNYIPVKVGYGKFDEGVAIFSKYPIVNSENTLLTQTNDYTFWKKRNSLGVEIVKENTHFWVYTAHLGWWNDDEEPFIKQWHKLNVVANKEVPVYLAGDFNAPDIIPNQSYETIKEDGWFDTRDLADDAQGRFTAQGKIDGWDEAVDGMRIDYIWCNKKEHVKSHHVIFDGTHEDVVSDHFGLFMEDSL